MMQETSEASGTSRRVRGLPDENNSVTASVSKQQQRPPRSSAASVASAASSAASYVSDYTTDSNNIGVSMGDNQSQIAQLRKSLRTEHKRLSDYEAQRRSTYSSKLESTSLYFKSLVDLSLHSISETSRAQRLVVGMAMAHQQYAQGLGANQAQYISSSAGNNTATTNGGDTPDTNATSSLLTAWEASNTAMAQQFQDNADFIQEEVANVLRAFLDAVQDQKDQLETVGSPIVSELEEMEKEVQQAWDAYFRVATEALKRLSGGETEKAERQFASPPTMVGGGPSPEEVASDSQQQRNDPEREDLWIVKMQYQVIVSQQIETWEKRGTELARMSAASKEMECARRINVQKCMGKFLESLQTLYQNLATGEGEAMAANAEAMAHSWKPEETELDVGQYFWLDNTDAGQVAVPTESQGLVTCSKVLQWKMSTDEDWKAALAVVTVDAFLHLFDLTPFANKEDDDDDNLSEPGSDPKTALANIFPHLAKHLQEDDDDVVLQPESKLVVPEKSLRLAGCSVSMDETGVCEVSETVQGTGARLFAKKAVVVLQMRLKSDKVKPQDLKELHKALVDVNIKVV